MKKILSLILCFSILFAFSSCTTGNNGGLEQSYESESKSGNEDNRKSSGDPTCIDEDIYNSLDLVYALTENSSMALVELSDVADGFYADGGDQAYIIVEYKILKDYYNNISENTIIKVPIFLDEINSSANHTTANYTGESIGIVDKDRISDLQLSTFIKQYQKAVIYIQKINSNQVWYKNGNYKDHIQYDKTTAPILLCNHYFPVGKNNIILFDEVLSFLNENNCCYASPYTNIFEFSDFVYTGLTLEQMEKNIQNLYQTQLKR